MLFQKGIQRQYVGGEGEGRYDATFCGIEEKWESNTGCLKWRREPCAKRNTAQQGVFSLQWTSPKHNRIVRATCWGRHGERQLWILIVLRPHSNVKSQLAELKIVLKNGKVWSRELHGNAYLAQGATSRSSIAVGGRRWSPERRACAFT